MPGESAPIHPEFLSVFWVQRPTYPLLWENLPTKVNASNYHFNIQKQTPKRWPKKRRDLPRTTRLPLQSPAQKQSNIPCTCEHFHTIIFKFLTCSNQSLLFFCSFHSANPPTRFMSPSTNKQRLPWCLMTEFSYLHDLLCHNLAPPDSLLLPGESSLLPCLHLQPTSHLDCPSWNPTSEETPPNKFPAAASRADGPLTQSYNILTKKTPLSLSVREELTHFIYTLFQ